MADEQEISNKEFYEMADSFIDIANEHCNKKDSSEVGSALLFATARFSSFVVASHSKDLESYESEIEHATDFFSKEFKRMLKQNLDEYKTAFQPSEEESKYAHLMKENKQKDK